MIMGRHPSRVASVSARVDPGPLASWLLHGGAQLAEGRHAGAVAGCMDLSGRVVYVYPEIAGYYLQWLAWRGRTGVDRELLAARAFAVRRWLRVWLADRDPPRTRIHFDDAEDWRNEAIFCFDLAMVLRGLAAATDAGLLAPDPGIVDSVVGLLEPLIAPDGAFVACQAIRADAGLPARWSTRRGGFLAKAAAGVIAAARTFPGMPPHVERAAHATFKASVDALLQTPHQEVHPLLYAFEGVLARPDDPGFREILPMLAGRFDALLASATADGTLPETLGTESERRGFARVDVIAQALRVGCLLKRHDRPAGGDRIALARLRHRLAREVERSGAVPFALGASPTEWNTWAAMFADQALEFAQPGGMDFDVHADPLLI